MLRNAMKVGRSKVDGLAFTALPRRNRTEIMLDRYTPRLSTNLASR